MIERDTQNLKLVVIFSLVSAALACGIGIAGCAGNVSSGKAAAAPGVVAVQITTAANLPAAISQSGYAAKLSVTGGVPPCLWVTTAGQLPVGLTLNPPTGAITGTPVKSGTYAFTTTVRDSKGSAASNSFSMVVTAKAPPASTPPTTTNNALPIQITTAGLPVGAVRNVYSTRLTASGGTPPYLWSTAAGHLPDGLALNSSTGDITGTPTLAGSFSFTTQVKDTKGGTVSGGFSLNVSTAPAPKVSGLTPNKGSVDGGTAVTISGTNFQPGTTVRFGGMPAASVQVNSGTQIQAVTPAVASGSVNVMVSASDGQTATAGSAFTFATAVPVGPVETADSADAFVDSAGVNVHLNFTDTPYGNFGAVEKALIGLGVRHLRDGLVDTTWTPYYDRLNFLGRSGIKATLITSMSQTAALLTAYPSRVADSFEAYEAPNEYDQSGDANWSMTMNTFLGKMSAAVKGNRQDAGFQILGPSLTAATSYPKVVASAAYVDVANLHNYMGGRNPGTPGWGAGGYGSIAWNMASTSATWPGKPVITTETGYCNEPSIADSVPEDVAARYLPRIFLEQWLHGIKRTYIYELVDVGGTVASNGYGLLHTDFTPKPGYTAVKNLLGLLADAGAGV